MIPAWRSSRSPGPRASCSHRSGGCSSSLSPSVFMGPRRKGRHPAFDARDPLLDARADAELDLHGFGAMEARSAVRAFLESWRRRRAGAVVHIVTGKGKGSPGAPVLRGLVKTLLQGGLRALASQWGLDDGQGGYRGRLR